MYFAKAKLFGKYADFSDAQFSGGSVYFFSTQFFGEFTNFINVHFSGGVAQFNGAQFLGKSVSFNNVNAEHSVEFNVVKISNRCSFHNAVFEQSSSFVDTKFPTPCGTESAFRGTQFLGPADFSRPTVTDENGKPLPGSDLHFPFNAFDNANIKDQLILSRRGEDYASKEFRRALKSTQDACRADTTDRQEERYAALEAGCTTLKLAMEKISDKTRAQRYFKFELLARQKRPSSGPLTKFMTWAYGLTADYGGSMWKPLASLFAAWIVFAIIFNVNAHLIDVSATSVSPLVWGPLDLSAANIFRPFLIWSKAILPGDQTWLGLYQETLSPGGWLAIKLLCTAQSFVSLTFLFLFGLAAKRKFQIG